MAKNYRLKTATDVRRYLAKVLNRLEAGELTDTEAKSRGYLAQIMSKVIETSDLEQRVDQLERAQE
jgi:hypothetical protein